MQNSIPRSHAEISKVETLQLVATFQARYSEAQTDHQERPLIHASIL
jgi:hypothetical protein